ncbi:MAG: hypothetical protein WDM89_22655 [Rhizomicrobium sp.]
MYKNHLEKGIRAIFFTLVISLATNCASAQVAVPPTTLDAPERWDADNYEPPPQLLSRLTTSDDLKREFGNIHYRVNICNETHSEVVVTIASIQGDAFDPAVAEIVPARSNLFPGAMRASAAGHKLRGGRS